MSGSEGGSGGEAQGNEWAVVLALAHILPRSNPRLSFLVATECQLPHTQTCCYLWEKQLPLRCGLPGLGNKLTFGQARPQPARPERAQCALSCQRVGGGAPRCAFQHDLRSQWPASTRSTPAWGSGPSEDAQLEKGRAWEPSLRLWFLFYPALGKFARNRSFGFWFFNCNMGE